MTDIALKHIFLCVMHDDDSQRLLYYSPYNKKYSKEYFYSIILLKMMNSNNDPIMGGLFLKGGALPILKFYCLLRVAIAELDSYRGTSRGIQFNSSQGTCGIGKHCSWPTVHHGVDHVINRGVELRTLHTLALG